MFYGRFEHNIDKKGRMTVPSKYREQTIGDLVCVTKGLDGNLMAYYAVNGGTPVSQAVTSQILSGDTLDFTFTTQADLTVTTTDQMFAIKTWIALTGDPIPANDTLLSNVASMHLPAPVVVTNATIPYGTSATLTATSSDTIQWYADASLISLLNTVMD